MSHADGAIMDGKTLRMAGGSGCHLHRKCMAANAKHVAINDIASSENPVVIGEAANTQMDTWVLFLSRGRL